MRRKPTLHVSFAIAACEAREPIRCRGTCPYFDDDCLKQFGWAHIEDPPHFQAGGVVHPFGEPIGIPR